jgi:hypothetical protein
MIKNTTLRVPLSEEELSRLNNGESFKLRFTLDDKKITIVVFKE